MRKGLWLILLTWGCLLQAQVCCSPAGSAQGGGGPTMSNWNTNWPSEYRPQGSWQILLHSRYGLSEPAGRIEFGPELLLHSELSYNLSSRTVLFTNTDFSTGSIHEHVSYSESRSLRYSGTLSIGFRQAYQASSGIWSALQFSLPVLNGYENPDFLFWSKNAPTIRFNQLMNLSVPSFIENSFQDISINLIYAKNMIRDERILTDHHLDLQLSSSFNLQESIFFIPLLLFRTQTFIAPLDLWEGERDESLLAFVSLGTDLYVTQAWLNKFALRLSVPIYSYSENGNLPEGTQAGSSLALSYNWFLQF